MVEIKEISNFIEEELDGAEKYAKLSLFYKDKDMAIAEMYYSLSNTEMQHVNLLHDQGVRLIDEYKKTSDVVPAEMLAVYNYLHKKHIDDANRVLVYQSQFRG